MIGLVYLAVGSGDEIVADGVTYKVPQVDSNGLLVATLDLTALTPPTTVATNQKAVASAGTAEQLQAQACVAVTVRALPDNSGNIYVGDSSVDSSNGHVLDAGAAVNLAIDNVNRLYVDADTNGDGVSWMAVA